MENTAAHPSLASLAVSPFKNASYLGRRRFRPSTGRLSERSENKAFVFRLPPQIRVLKVATCYKINKEGMQLGAGCLSGTGSILAGRKAVILFSVRLLSTSHGVQSHEIQEMVPVLSISRARVAGWMGRMESSPGDEETTAS